MGHFPESVPLSEEFSWENILVAKAKSKMVLLRWGSRFWLSTCHSLARRICRRALFQLPTFCFAVSSQTLFVCAVLLRWRFLCSDLWPLCSLGPVNCHTVLRLCLRHSPASVCRFTVEENSLLLVENLYCILSLLYVSRLSSCCVSNNGFFLFFHRFRMRKSTFVG